MRVHSIRTSTRHELYTATPVEGAGIYDNDTAFCTQHHQQTTMAKLTYTPCFNMLL
jgi:hypothetical protein